MSAVLPPLVEIGDALVPCVGNTNEPPTSPVTSAVTRSWSHVDRVTLFTTFAATSFAYSFFGNPLFLAVARQQCSITHVTVRQVLNELYVRHGVRGFFRGAGVAISGTVVSEFLYYLIVEYGKEHLPFPTLEQRSLVGGFAADLVSGPVYNPFGVVSQVQMVADSRYGEHRYSNGLQTTRSILAEQGWRALFRGTLLTVILAPLTGAWWLVYELLKHRAYNVVACASPSLVFIIPPEVRRRIPECCTSTTDNLLVNCSVGATASMVISLLLNPFYVLRLRLQVDKNIGYARFPSFVIMKSVLRREGIQAFFKGLHTNLFMAAVGGCAFGMTYEGAKQFSDIT